MPKIDQTGTGTSLSHPGVGPCSTFDGVVSVPDAEISLPCETSSRVDVAFEVAPCSGAGVLVGEVGLGVAAMLRSEACSMG